MSVPGRDIAQQGRRLREMADDQIETAVVVQVSDRHAPSVVFALKIRAPFFGSFYKLRLPALQGHAAIPKNDRKLIGIARIGIAVGMTVDNDDVLPAAVFQIDESGAPTDVPIADYPHAGPARGVAKTEVSFGVGHVLIEGVQIVFPVRDPDRRPARAVVISSIESHAAVRLAAVVLGDSQHLPKLLQAYLSRLAAIQVEEIVGGVVGHVDVRLAVAVHVDEQHAEPLAVVLLLIRVPQPLFRRLAHVREAIVVFRLARHTQPGLVADIEKAAVTKISIQGVRASLELHRPTQVPFFGFAVLAMNVVVQRPVHVLADVKIGVAVAIQVSPGGAGAPEMLPEQTGLLCHVNELSALCRIAGIDRLIVEQSEPAVTGDE